MTALGIPVDPEVKSSLPTVSGVIAAIDSATADVTELLKGLTQRFAGVVSVATELADEREGRQSRSTAIRPP